MVKSDEAIQRISQGRAMIFSEEFVYIDEPWILTWAWIAKIIVYLGMHVILLSALVGRTTDSYSLAPTLQPSSSCSVCCFWMRDRSR
jgi:hypothetical protein